MMRTFTTKKAIAAGVFSLVLLLIAFPAAAGDTLLSNNIGAGNQVFFIEGESSVVINGFDLTPLGVPQPVALDAVSISVDTTVPGSAIELLVYQDANGGSPVDATLVYRQTVALEFTGVNRIELSQPAIITAPVLWVGFNLPVGFKFHADTSGPSVLTYWAWTTGGTFDLSALSSAGVLGPGDGSEPVNIAMDGIARITAELRGAEYEEIAVGLPLDRQVFNDVAQDTSIMRPYSSCANLLFDPEDIEISAGSSFALDCILTDEFHAPSLLAQPYNQNLELLRIGTLYKLTAQIPPQLRVGGAVSTLPVPVTHCMRVAEGDLQQAVLGEIRAQPDPKPGPEKWHIMPTVRFGDLVCAEVTRANYLAYFVPETEDSPQNVNLVVGWTRSKPNPLYCGINASIQAPVVNTGQDWFDTDDSHITIAVQDIHVASSIVTEERSFDIATSQLGPGARQSYELGPFVVDSYVNDLHRLQVTVDLDNEVDEINEVDNVWFTEYVLTLPPGYDKCEQPPLTGSWDNCKYQFDHRYQGSDLALMKAIEDLEYAVFFPSRLNNEDGIENESVAFEYLRRAVSDERWDLIESWFHTSRKNIMEEVWEAMVNSRDRIYGGRCPGGPKSDPS